MTSFSHLWGCEWTPSKAALWHLLVVKTLWDARGGYRFRSAANARSTQPRRYVLGRRVFATRAVRVPRCTTPSKRIHQVLQYHLITRFFSSRLTYFRAKTNTPRRREEKRREERAYSSFQMYQLLLLILHFFPFFCSLRKKQSFGGWSKKGLRGRSDHKWQKKYEALIIA